MSEAPLFLWRLLRRLEVGDLKAVSSSVTTKIAREPRVARFSIMSLSRYVILPESTVFGLCSSGRFEKKTIPTRSMCSISLGFSISWNLERSMV